MQVKLLTTMADATRVAMSGQVIEVEKKEGQALIAGGYATAVDPGAVNRSRRAERTTPPSEGGEGAEGDGGSDGGQGGEVDPS